MTEKDLINKIRMSLSEKGCRLFRNHVGLFYSGNAKRLPDGSILIKNPRVTKIGTPGMSDLIGWTPLIIKEKKYSIFTSLEVKTNNTKTTSEQINFIQNVCNSGGIGKVIYNLEQAEELIDEVRLSWIE